MSGVEKHRFIYREKNKSSHLSTLASDTTGQLDVLRHDSHTLGMDSAQVRVLEKTNQVRLGGFLEGKNGRALEAQVLQVTVGTQ